MYYGGFTYSDVRSLPLSYRTWFLSRIIKEISTTNQSREENPPEINLLQGKIRDRSPSRIRRF